MKKSLFLSALVMTMLFETGRFACSDDDFVVKIFSTYQGYNAYYPWEKNKFSERTAFGTLLEGGYILTTADTVSDFACIEMKKPANEKKYPASVAYVDYGCNIALLKSEESEFYEGLSPVLLSESLLKDEEIQVVQIKSNNDIHYIAGTVEKVSIEESYLGWDEYLSYLLSVKLENRSHWAEPVMKENRLAGIVTTYDSNRFLATVIPVERIRHFMSDISDGSYDGFPDPGFYWEPLTNPFLKKYLDMADDLTGVFVTRVVPESSADKILQRGDVLLKAGGVVIDDKGYFADKAHGKLSLTYLFTSRSPGEKIEIEILRDGKRIVQEAVLKRFTPKDYFIPLYSYDEQSNYIIEGGFVIQEVTTEYLKTWGQDWQDEANKKLLYYYNYFSRTSPDDRENLIVLSFVIPDDINIGYQNFRTMIVENINGRKVRSIADVARAFDEGESRFIQIFFDGTKQAILDRNQLKSANERIARRYKIHKMRNL
ncbi:MAG: hypothetical protein JW928_03175 [Candidatus Aureabacteria bacterium]|nr:hypothetical protein [Candidatus Auribacterota bacterium]